MKRFGSVWLLMSCSVLILGCGTGRGDLSGTVAHQGKAVKFGTVCVFGGDGVPKYGEIDREGKYTVKDIAAGNCKITVSSPHPKTTVGEATREEQGGDRKAPGRGAGAKGPDPVDVKNWFAIPENYQYADKSGLNFTLKAGPNAHNIDLK